MQDQLSDTPRSANYMIAVFRTMLEFGVKRGYRADNPAVGIDRIKIDDSGHAPWPETGYQFVKDHAPVYLYRMAFLGRATGQRRSDLVKMRPTDLTADGINVRIQKLRGKPHMVPLTKAQMAEIRSWPVRDLQFFIMSPAGKKCSATYLNELWYNWRTSETAKPIREMKMTIHGLRSTAINDRRREGATDGGIADELCMSAKMVSRYLRFADKVESGRASRDRREQSRPNLQTRRSICKHSGAKMLKKLAFQKTYLIGHQRRKFPGFRTWMPATSTGHDESELFRCYAKQRPNMQNPRLDRGP